MAAMLKPVEFDLYFVTAGADTFYAAGKGKRGNSSMIDALNAVFAKYGASTSDDLPKPFSMHRIKTVVIVPVPKKPKKRKAAR